MEYLLKIHFIILFSLYIFTFIKLYKKGFGFSLGIVIGVLHFIFIPLLILTFTNKLPIDLIGFYDTKLIDVIMSETIIHSLILIAYLYSILAYIFIVEFIIYKNRNQTIVHLPLNWKLYFIFYLTIGIFIFVASGIHSGGHWYNSSVEFFQSNGLWILVIIYGFFATKLIFITSLLTSFNSNKISLIKFSLIALLFSFIDVIITGNRIFVFVLLAAVAVILFQRYRFKLLIFGFFIIPFGYLMSIYRIIRGSIFLKGIPSIKELINIVVETVSQEPPAIGSFLLGISESVNFNVLYQIFDYISFETALWGETYLKTFVFFLN